MVWTFEASRGWNDDVTFHFGPSDLAQVLVTSVYLVSVQSPIVEDVARATQMDIDRENSRLARYLIRARDESADDSSGQLAFWADYFQTAEVIESLASYASQYKSGPNGELSASCNKEVVSCIQRLESEQEDGRWGTHTDTCRSLFAYMRTARLVDGIEPQPHIVLKALRWICDKKQVFDDGSFLHTSFITVFFVQAVWESYRHWDIADRQVIDAYDLALWSTPVRTTPERAKRLRLQVRLDELQANKTETDRRRRLYLATAVGGAIMVLGLGLAASLSYLAVDIKSDNFWAVLGVVTPFALGAAGLIRGWPALARSAAARFGDADG
jgi:hypothetical protein